jgi:anti-anti-sigma factor
MSVIIDGIIGGSVMKMSQQEIEGVCVCRFEGSLDTDAADQLRTSLHHVMESSEGPVVLNLEKVGFLSSVGLSALITFRQRLSAKNRKLALCGLSIPIHKLFKISCLDSVFDIVPSESEALSELGE